MILLKPHGKLITEPTYGSEACVLPLNKHFITAISFTESLLVQSSLVIYTFPPHSPIPMMLRQRDYVSCPSSYG